MTDIPLQSKDVQELPGDTQGITSSKTEWLTMKEASVYLRVHPKTVYRYVKTGMLSRHGAGRPRFLKEDLDNLMRNNSKV